MFNAKVPHFAGKGRSRLLTAFVALLSLAMLSADWYPKPAHLRGPSARVPGCTEVFSGRVLSPAGEAVRGAEVSVAGLTTTTDQKGAFRLELRDACCSSCAEQQSRGWADCSRMRRFVLNVRRPGYGLLSKVYGAGVQDVSWRMTPATTTTFDPNQPIVLTNLRAANACTGTLSSKVDWQANSALQPPRLYATNGQPSTQPVPQDVLDSLAFAENASVCNGGATVAIPAQSLVDAGGQAAQEPVAVSISTVDVYDADSMPGDFSVNVNGRAGYMLTFGAGTVTVSGKKGAYQLKKGAAATLTIPIHPLQLKQVRKLPAEIPLLLYDEKAGEWRVHGRARLDERQQAYVGKVSHLSAYNMDLVKTDQACVRIDSSGIAGDYLLEVVIPDASGTVIRTVTVDNSPDTLHAIYNLPSNTNISLRGFRDAGMLGFELITDTTAVNTGPPQNPGTPNQPAFPYSACNSQVALVEWPHVPSLSGPFASTGTFTLTWTYKWRSSLGSTSDGYALEESATSATSGFTEIFRTALQGLGDRQSPKSRTLTKGPGTYFYRVRAYEIDHWTDWSNVHQVVVSTSGGPSPTTLRIINDLYDQEVGGAQWGTWNAIIRVRIGPTLQSVTSSAAYEKLYPTDGPVTDPALLQQIPPAYNQSSSYHDLDVSGFGPSGYWVYMQAGWWDPWFDPNTFDFIGWSKHMTVVYNCDGQTATFKWATVQIIQPFGSPEVIRASDWLPHWSWNGTPFCAP